VKDDALSLVGTWAACELDFANRCHARFGTLCVSNYM
jgi:hypothetical protein